MNFVKALRNAIRGIAAARRPEMPLAPPEPWAGARLIDKPLPPFPVDRMGTRCLWCYVRDGSPHVFTPEGKRCPAHKPPPEEGLTNDT